MTPPSVPAPLHARVAFAHAALAYLASANAVDLLHIKGAAVDPRISARRRFGTDADVLVRPAHLGGFQAVMARNGWGLSSSFTWGSPFGHAATWHHPLWGYADVHRYFPGISLEASGAFDRLWRERGVREIAGLDCDVPSTTAQAVILVLNAARGSVHGPRDVAAVWDSVSPARRAAMVDLVSELGAEVAFAAGIGELERFRGRREYALWRVVSRGGTRVEEWVARIRAAPSLIEGARIALRAPRVNTDHLAARLGRGPTRREVVREFFARPVRGAAEEMRSLARRWRMKCQR